jgi:hypothetical protein
MRSSFHIVNLRRRFEFGAAMKLVRLIKMCLNETYSEVLIRKDLSDHHCF